MLLAQLIRRRPHPVHVGRGGPAYPGGGDCAKHRLHAVPPPEPANLPMSRVRNLARRLRVAFTLSDPVHLANVRTAEIMADLMVRAGRARDVRDQHAAALLYEAALRIQPDHFGIQVQCGHMFKEAGELATGPRTYYLAAERRCNLRTPTWLSSLATSTRSPDGWNRLRTAIAGRWSSVPSAGPIRRAELADPGGFAPSRPEALDDDPGGRFRSARARSCSLARREIELPAAASSTPCPRQAGWARGGNAVAGASSARYVAIEAVRGYCISSATHVVGDDHRLQADGIASFRGPRGRADLDGRDEPGQLQVRLQRVAGLHRPSSPAPASVDFSLRGHRVGANAPIREYVVVAPALSRKPTVSGMPTPC